MCKTGSMRNIADAYTDNNITANSNVLFNYITLFILNYHSGEKSCEIYAQPDNFQKAAVASFK